MKTASDLSLVRILHYVFMALTIAFTVLFVLQLISFFGLPDGHFHIRGWVTQVTDFKPTVVPHPDGSGDLKMFNMGEKRLVTLEFKDMESMLKLRYLGYIFFQNLAFALGVMVLYQMTRIFRNLDLGETFRAENVRRVRNIAFLVVAFPAARFVAGRLLSDIVYTAGGHQITSAGSAVNFEEIVFGGLVAMIIFAVAEVFRRGEHLQQEQDLTV